MFGFNFRQGQAISSRKRCQFKNIDSVRLIKVNSKIGNIDIKAIVLGDANIEKKKSDKTQYFICIVGEKGKVLLTIFSDQ